MDVDDRSMDMMAMMMQKDKFPEFSEPVFPEPQFSTATLPILPNSSNVVPPTLINSNPPPSFLNHNINPIHHPMAPAQPLQPYKEVQARVRNSNNNNNINVNTIPYPSSSSEKRNSMAAVREMIFRIAVMQPIHIDPESIKLPKRRNVKISKDPQSVAARHRRERISERIRILQRLVPGGTKMDTASMLDEAIHYVKFLKKQVQALEQAGANTAMGFGLPTTTANRSYSSLYMKGYYQGSHMVGGSFMQMLS